MGWWDRYVWRRTEHRDVLTLEQLLQDDARPTAAGEPVTVDTALRLSTVWGCVRLLADSVSTLPLQVYRGDDRDPIPTPLLLQRLSVGFQEVPGGSRWSPDRRRVTRTRAALDHVAVVRVPAYAGAGVVGVRSVPSPTPLLDLARLRR